LAEMLLSSSETFLFVFKKYFENLIVLSD